MVLENAEETPENRSNRRKQLLCAVVDFINNEGFSTFKGLRFEENTLKGSNPLKWLVEASGGVFQQRGCPSQAKGAGLRHVKHRLTIESCGVEL